MAFFGRHSTAGKCQLHRDLTGQAFGQSKHSTRTSHQTPSDLGQAELCRVASHDHVARQRHLEAASQGVPLDGGNDWFHRLCFGDRRETPPLDLGALAGFRKRLQVHTSAEGATCPGDDANGKPRIRIEHVECVGHFQRDGMRDCVAHLGPVDRNNQGLAPVFGLNKVPHVNTIVDEPKLVNNSDGWGTKDFCMTTPRLDTSPQAVGVVGAGTMGTGIAYVFAVAGSQVTVVEPSTAQVAVLWAAIDGALAGAVKRNKITPEDAALARARIHPVGDIDRLPEAADLVIESVPEDLALKTSVLHRIEQRRPTTLATNTSSISIDSLASSLSEPGRFLGMHFFNPVWSLPLVELIAGAATEPDTLAAARSAVDALGKQSITVTDIPGFATSRLDMSAALEAMRMLEDGVASATDIDRAAVLAYRHPVGPLELSDIVGLDVRLDIARSLHASHGERYAPPAILIAKVAAGDLGKKTGRGFHDWTSANPAHSNTT